MLGLIFWAGGSVKADLVVNGNFATGDFTGFNLTGDTAEVYVSGVPGAFSAALSTDSTDGFLSQTLATTAGQKYSVSFLLSGDGATPNSFTASLGGTTLISLTNIPNDLAAPVTETFTYTASSSSSALVFDFVDNPGYEYLTNISVNPLTSSVPEPSTVAYVCLGGAVMLVGHVRRERRESDRV